MSCVLNCDKYAEKCSNCGWNQKHPVTGHSPLEIDHIDGNANNNNEANLRLLCPNCHSLTVTYKNLNKGNGRKWR
jgi:Zn finger protein HypA/HybF involved in hydrogenase expression